MAFTRVSFSKVLLFLGAHHNPPVMLGAPGSAMLAQSVSLLRLSTSTKISSIPVQERERELIQLWRKEFPRVNWSIYRGPRRESAHISGFFWTAGSSEGMAAQRTLYLISRGATLRLTTSQLEYQYGQIPKDPRQYTQSRGTLNVK
jgi:hypothetical protein